MSYVPHSTFLDIFAQSVDFATYKDQLTPVSILFYQDKILSDLESGLITKVFFHHIKGEICEILRFVAMKYIRFV